LATSASGVLATIFALIFALAGEQVGGDCVVAEPGEAPADVLDMLVHAENLVDHQHDGKGPAALGRGMIGRNHGVASVDARLARINAFGGRRDRLRRHRRDRRAEAEPEARFDHGAAGHWPAGQAAQRVWLVFAHGDVPRVERPPAGLSSAAPAAGNSNPRHRFGRVGATGAYSATN
jgi:hypothetical protein